MADIVVTAIRPQDRTRWAELWRGYLDFYETELPPEIYEYTWQRLIAAESPIRGLGARLGGDTAPLVGITHYLFHAHAWMSLFEIVKPFLIDRIGECRAGTRDVGSVGLTRERGARDYESRGKENGCEAHDRFPVSLSCLFFLPKT